MLCVKGFKAAKEIMEHAVLSLYSKTSVCILWQRSDKDAAVLMISQHWGI